MGQNASLPKERPKKNLRRFSKSSNKGRNLSYTFTVSDNQEKIELLNINTATEEELMTLPSINRELAKNIVEYRKFIIRFKKVEDLALVNGIGAEKLETIRSEICVNSNKQTQSCTTSRAPSYDSLKSTDSKYINRTVVINVNEASVFELQNLHGITQETAAAIVNYRNKKGPFTKLDDLLKVKGINRLLLNNINHYLSVNTCPEFEDKTNLLINRINDGLSNNRNNLKERKEIPTTLLSMTNCLSSSSLYDIFELLSTYSPRPILEETFNYLKDEKPVFRVASWNLDNFSYDKACNLGVKEVICRTILENGWSILAVQDVLDADALKVICDELNKPQLRRIKEWKNLSHYWNFCMLDKEESNLGFIYESRDAISIELNEINKGPNDKISDFSDIVIAIFKIGTLNFHLINLKLNKITNITLLRKKINELINENDRAIVFVDFSNYTLEIEDAINIPPNLNNIFPSTINTNVIISKMDILKNYETSNILCNLKLKQHLTGTKKIVKKGLFHLGIPNGWNWGGIVSKYCPLWIELFQQINNSNTS